MNYLKFPLGHLSSGAMVEVVLKGVESEVFLADDSNVRKLERGDLKDFRGHGGLYKQSPVRLGVPSTGPWTVIVIPAGGRVEASVRVVSSV